MSEEFLFVIAALLIIFIIFYAIYLGQKANLLQTQDTLASTYNVYSVAAVMNYVYLAGNGAQYNFTLATKGQEENLTVFGHAVESQRPHGRAQAPLLNGNVNTTNISGGQMMIRNNNGAIEIGQ